MSPTNWARTLHRLDTQGFDGVEESTLIPVAPWLRMAPAMCGGFAFMGTAMQSPILLWSLAVIAMLGAAFPVHPFDLLYNHGLRRFTGTSRLPRRGAPGRFACGMGTAWLLTTGWAFQTGQTGLGLALGFMLAAMATHVAMTNICGPSILYRFLFNKPLRRDTNFGGHEATRFAQAIGD